MDFHPLLEIEFQPEHLFCNIHGQPFRPHWPRGVDKMRQMFIRWLETTEHEIEQWWFEPDEAAVDLIEKPWCCRVSPGVLMDLYRRTGVGKQMSCGVCHKFGTGSTIMYRTAAGIISTKEVCWECLLFRTRRLDQRSQ